MSGPLFDIHLTFDFLRSDATAQEVQQVIGFIGAHAGRGLPFLFSPPQDLSVRLGAPLGMGDGATTVFVLSCQIGGFAQHVQALSGAPTIYLNGVVLPASAYTVSILPATVTFAVAPASGSVLTIDFTAAHLSCFADDCEDLEQLMSGFWTLKTLKLETVRA